MIGMRDLNSGDRDRLFDWRNRPDVARWMYTDHVITVDEHDRWFDAIGADTRRRYWVITLDNQEVGLANLADIDKAHLRCSWAFYLAEERTRGRGVGAWVEHFVLTTVFDHLHLNRLCCEVLATNPAVVAMHEGFGFRREGLMRQHVWRDETPIDVVPLSMLRADWELCRPGIEARLMAKGLLGGAAS